MKIQYSDYGDGRIWVETGKNRSVQGHVQKVAGGWINSSRGPDFKFSSKARAAGDLVELNAIHKARYGR